MVLRANFAGTLSISFFLTDGFTPLMLAAMRGTPLDSQEEDSGSGSTSESQSDEDPGAFINDLLMQGAALNARTDRYVITIALSRAFFFGENVEDP